MKYGSTEEESIASAEEQTPFSPRAQSSERHKVSELCDADPCPQGVP